MQDPLAELLQQYASRELRAAVAQAREGDGDPLRFPDTPVNEIVDGLAKLNHHPVRGVLHDFGRFIGATLIVPHASRQPVWKTLEVLAHAGDILRATRLAQGDARPLFPDRACTRTGPDELLMAFPRGRHWCHIARGMADAIAAHFGEKVEHTEPACLSRGAAACHLFVRRVASAGARPVKSRHPAAGVRGAPDVRSHP